MIGFNVSILVEALRDYSKRFIFQGGSEYARKLADLVEAAQPAAQPLTFEQAWATYEAKGFRYGSDALEQVRFGWKIAQEFAVRVQPAAQPQSWRDHVEQRLLTWRQRFVNKSGDQLALDDFMDKESLDDLIDFVCDEWAQPAQQEPVAWLVTVKKRPQFVRACWTEPPSRDQLEAAEYDGDTITPLYAAKP